MTPEEIENNRSVLVFHRKAQWDIPVERPWLVAHLEALNASRRMLCIAPGRCDIDPELYGLLLARQIADVRFEVDDGLRATVETAVLGLGQLGSESDAETRAKIASFVMPMAEILAGMGDA